MAQPAEHYDWYVLTYGLFPAPMVQRVRRDQLDTELHAIRSHRAPADVTVYAYGVTNDGELVPTRKYEPGKIRLRAARKARQRS